MEKKAQDESSKETLKLYSVSSQIRLNKNNSKEKICNDQQKVKNTSKLPRIVRMPTRYYKPIDNSPKSTDDSGDSLPGPSKLEGGSTKMKKEDMIPEKLKISHIPRLKSHKEGPKEINVPSKTRPSRPSSTNQFIPERRNVQRVNILINPEFCPDDRAPPMSIQATRPIPTLGQIYGRMNMIDSDRLNEWFMELRTPMNSIRSSNGRITNSSDPHALHCSSSTIEDLQRRSALVMESKSNLTTGVKPTKEDANTAGVGQSTDVEVPTRDNDSGYKTLSLKTSQKLKPIVMLKKSQQSQAGDGITMNTNQTYCVDLMGTAVIPSKPKIGVECSTDTSSLIRQQQTVVLCGTSAPQRVEEGTITSKSYVSLKPSRLSKITEANNNKTCCSNANQTTGAPVLQVPVPSYTDCFSEVLEKTTNFEVIDGIEPTKSPSSGAVIDTGLSDKVYIIEATKTTIDEMCEVDNSTTTDSYQTKQSKSSDNTTLLRSEATVTDWSCKHRSEHSSEYHRRDSNNFRRDLSRRYYDDSLHNETRERCNKCHRFKRFPSTRYKLPRSFGSWRSGGSIRRLCCRRWNHVWKKTAERWAIWSTRSPTKSRRFHHPLQHLVRSVIWEDVDVQTNILIYNETGTDSVMKEQKSAAINTVFNMETLQAICNLADSGSKTSNKFKHVNSGPSMFPFFLNTKGKTSTIITTDKNLSGYQFPNCLQNQCTYTSNITWNADAAMGLFNSVKSCQYQVPDEIAVQEQTTSLEDEVKVNLSGQPTDTADLPTCTNVQKTPAPAPIRFSMQKIEINKDSCITNAVQQNVIMCHNAEAEVKFPFCGASSSITEPSESDITYYRPVAASDITQLISETRTQQALFPILRKFYSNAASAVNREKDDLVAGIGTQISPGESVDTTSMGVTTSKQLVTERTTSFSTMNGAAVERVDCALQIEEFPTQTTQPAEAAAAEGTSQINTEIETQMTPLKATSVASAGITTSIVGEKDEPFMSECVLTSKDAAKVNLAVQTRPAVPRLAFTGPRVLSISSEEVPHKIIPVLYAEDLALGSHAALTASSKAVGSSAAAVVVDAIAQRSNTTAAAAVENNAPMESRASNATTVISKSASSDETVSTKCCCNLGDTGSSRPREVVSCATGPNTAVYNFTRSTSARGLDSYYETEILLNNLIKKALIGNKVGCHHTRSTDKSDTSIRSRYNMIYVTTSTNTNVGIQETKSIGPTASDMTKLTSVGKADAEIQYIEQVDITGYDRDHIIAVCDTQNLIANETPTQTEGFEKFEVSTNKSASMMTSYCGLPAAIQVPPISATTVKTENSRKSVTRTCSSHMIHLDMETNTNYKQGPVTENLEQTSMVQTTQKTLEVNIFRNCSSTPENSKPELPNNVNNQLLTLSHLIGKKKTDSRINSEAAEHWINEYPSVKTSPHPTTLPNSVNYNSKNAFESKMPNTDDENRKPCTFALKTDTDVDNPMSYELPKLILSKDSLADVLPVIKSKAVYSKKSETEFSLNRLMVDEFTSDNYVTKEVKESILQACPEICDAGTESQRPSCTRKSACVLTTQCVLPPPLPCGGRSFTPKCRDCVFLYGQPRCVVHKVDYTDAAIQLDPLAEEVNVRRELVTHSVGLLTSHCSLRDGSQRNPSALIKEVLTPKVYKALYDTTKLVAGQNMKQPSSRNATVVAARVDAEVDAAKFDMPQLKSASVLTSKAVMGSQSRCYCGGRGSDFGVDAAKFDMSELKSASVLTSEAVMGSQSRCHCGDRGSHLGHGVQVMRSDESYKDSSLVSHEETKEGCCEACMKRHLVTSCRYYSNLLTKHLGRVKYNLTRHLAPSMEEIKQQPQPNNEACTMKPSGRNVFASQTLKYTHYYNPTWHMSCGMLSPATSLTNICKYDKAHLKSVYFTLSAIEGRLRRLKLSSPNT